MKASLKIILKRKKTDHDGESVPMAIGSYRIPARPALLRAPSLKLWRKRMKLCEAAIRRAFA